MPFLFKALLHPDKVCFNISHICIFYYILCIMFSLLSTYMFNCGKFVAIWFENKYQVYTLLSSLYTLRLSVYILYNGRQNGCYPCTCTLHCAAWESKYIKNIYHKCCNGTLLRGTVANSCISLCFVLPKSCLSYLKALMTTLALISKIWGDLGIYLYHIWEEWLRKLFGIMLVMLPESLYSYFIFLQCMFKKRLKLAGNI